MAEEGGGKRGEGVIGGKGWRVGGGGEGRGTRGNYFSGEGPGGVGVCAVPTYMKNLSVAHLRRRHTMNFETTRAAAEPLWEYIDIYHSRTMELATGRLGYRHVGRSDFLPRPVYPMTSKRTAIIQRRVNRKVRQRTPTTPHINTIASREDQREETSCLPVHHTSQKKMHAK